MTMYDVYKKNWIKLSQINKSALQLPKEQPDWVVYSKYHKKENSILNHQQNILNETLTTQ